MIKSNEFEDLYPSDEDIKDIPKQPNFDFDAEIEEVEKELKEEKVKNSAFFTKYMKGNLPPFKCRPLLPFKKYRIYIFLIKRKRNDEPLIFKTVAINNSLAIDNVQEMFGKDITDLFYISPMEVSKEMYPKQIKEELK